MIVRTRTRIAEPPRTLALSRIVDADVDRGSSMAKAVAAGVAAGAGTAVGVLLFLLGDVTGSAGLARQVRPSHLGLRVMSVERREHRRFRGPFDAVRLGLLNHNLRVYDLSAGGCFIESLDEISDEHPIRLRINLPDGHAITVRGIVTLPARDVGYAVRFVDVDRSAKEMIERVIAYAEETRSEDGRSP